MYFGPEAIDAPQTANENASLWQHPTLRTLLEQTPGNCGAFYMCSLGWQAAGPTRFLANHQPVLRAHAGPPQWGEDNHYAGPLPKWCGHHHPKGPASTSAQRFPDEFVNKLLKGINKEIVRSKATDSRGEMAPATLSPDGKDTWTSRAGPATCPVTEGKLYHLGYLPEQAFSKCPEPPLEPGSLEPTVKPVAASSAGGRPEPDLADRDTSDDDEDGVPRPKRGSGNVGYGRPMPARWGGGASTESSMMGPGFAPRDGGRRHSGALRIGPAARS
jgi:hypothetical protein